MGIIYVTCCWFLGIWLAANVELPLSVWLVAAAGTILIAAIGARRHRPVFALSMLCVAALGAGGARLTMARADVSTPTHVSTYNGAGPLSLTGDVVGEPTLSDTALTVRVQAAHATVDGQERSLTGVVLVRLPRFAQVQYGQRLTLTGRLEVPPADGSFDYRAYLARQGIHSQMLWPVLERVEAGLPHPFYRALYAFKARAQATVNQLFPGQEAALLSGILLGNEEGLSPELQEAFRRTGTAHIIAISGFNIALLVGMLLALARPFFGPRRAAWIPLVGVGLYTLLVGADAAVLRAAIMGGLYVGAGRLLGRPTFIPGVLFTAGLLMTLANPFLLWEVGFQLSFAATLGLVLYVPSLSRRARAWLSSRDYLFREDAKRLLGALVETLLVTVVAQITTLPLLLYHFGQFSLIGLPANLLIMPAQPGAMVVGGLATLVGLVAPLPAVPLAWVAGLFLRYTMGVVRSLAYVPLASVGVEIGPAGLVGLYVLLLALSWLIFREGERHHTLVRHARGRARQVLPALGVLILLLAWQWANTQPDGYLHVSFLDVGQGDAIFVQTPAGRQALIDGGHYPSRLNDRLDRHLPFWDRHLDLLVATHPDADHVAGLPDLFRRYYVDLLLAGPAGGASAEEGPYRALLEIARARGVPIRRAQAGEQIVLDEGVTLECLHPGPLASEGGNEDSLAFRLVYGEFTLLLTGDLGATGEKAMVDSGLPLQSLILKAGHHGARTSSNDFFLAAVQPRVVVVSVGAENRFGHPHPEMLARADDAGATILRTDQLGTIEIVTDGQQMWWEAFP